MNKWLEIILGIILLVVAVYAWVSKPGGIWGLGTAALTFFKGGIVWFIILIGLLFLMLGISDLKG